jgi:hypothetical protein
VIACTLVIEHGILNRTFDRRRVLMVMEVAACRDVARLHVV